METLEKDFHHNYDQYHSVVEYQLNSMIKLNYQQNFEQMKLVIDNGKQTIERAILELNNLCGMWAEYEKMNQLFLTWLNQTENQLTNYFTIQNFDDEQIISDLNQFNENIRNQDKHLRTLEELESAIGEYDWTRQAHNTTILRQRYRSFEGDLFF